MGRPVALVEGLEVEEVGGVDLGLWGALKHDLGGADEAEMAAEVPERLERVWSMFLSDWMTDCLSNLSRTEMVLTTSSKECGAP